MSFRYRTLLIGTILVTACSCFIATPAAAQQRVEQRFDDQYGFGYAIDAPRRRYLADALTALTALLASEPPPVAATEAPGCVPAESPTPRAYPEGWQIGVPDAVFEFAEPVMVKATGVMPYQTVIVETNLPEDRWVQAIEVQPGDRNVVHHALIHLDGPDGNAGDSPRDEAARERGGFWGEYVPGQNTLVYPAGFAKKLPKGARLGFQMHYTPNGKATTDRTRVGVIYAHEPPQHEVRVAGIVSPRISIPPGVADHREEASLRLPVAATEPAGPVDRSLPWVTDEAAAPRVAFRTFESRAAAGKVSYHVYSPAEYDEPDARLPVLYWLHGTLGGVAGIRPLSAHFDAAIRAGRMPPLLIVFVNGLPRGLWANSKNGSAPVETVFITELIPEVDRSFRTVPTREGRILEGFSMGGYGAARLGFSHPDLFAGISILAGGPLDLDLDGPRARRNPQLREFLIRDVCGGDLGYFRGLSPWTLAEQAAAPHRERKTVIRQAVGTRDDTRALNHQFHERMTALGIDHRYHEIPDVGHDAAAVLAALATTDGDFYRRALATPDTQDR